MGFFKTATVFLLVAISPAVALARPDPVASEPGPDPLAGCREILSEWARLEEAEYEQTGSYRAVLSGTHDGVRKAGEVVVSTKPRHKLMTMRAENGTENVCARSPRYGFALQRPPGKTDWTLMTFVEGEGEAEMRQLEQALVTSLGLPILYPLGTAGVSQKGSRFFEKNTKRLRQASYDREKRRLVFAYDNGYHGIIETDPDRGNVITRVEAAFEPAPGSRRVSFVRELVPDGTRPDSTLPLCKSFAGTIVNDQTGKTIIDARITFSDYTFEPPADELFLLSHYGLPEPSGQPAPNKIPVYVWLLIAAAACAALGFLVRYVARRRTQPLLSGGPGAAGGPP